MPTTPARPLRVVVATRIYRPEPAAAAYRLAAMVRGLEEAGHQVRVLTTSAPGESGSTASVRRWPVLRDASGAVRGYLQYASFDIPLFFRLLFSRRFDVVVAEPPPTTGVVVRAAAALRRRPYCYFAADVSSVAAEGIGVPAGIVRVLRGVERWVLGGASTVLTVSAGVTAAVTALAPSAAVTEVGTGIDTDLFPLAGPRQPNPGRYFVYAGTISEIQGFGVFVDAFGLIAEEYPDVGMLVFGQGTELAEHRRRAERYRGRIDFRGVADSEEVGAALRGSVAGLASVRPFKGYDFAFATKALVALSCGTRVVYAGVGPLREVIDSQRLGFSADWEAAAVASAMKRALDTDHSAADADRLSEWVSGHHSLTSVGRRAAAAISAAVPRR